MKSKPKPEREMMQRVFFCQSLLLLCSMATTAGILSVSADDSISTDKPVAAVDAGKPDIDVAAQEKQLAKLILPLIRSHQGQVNVMLKHLPSGATFAHQADSVSGTASLIKLPLLVTLYDEVDNGRADLDAMITLQAKDMVPGSGILTTQFSPGLTLSLRDAAHLMIVRSDNTATNLVIDAIGLDSTNEKMKSLGLTETRLNSKLYRRRTTNDLPRSKLYGIGSTTPAEMVSLLERLHENQLFDKATTKQVTSHLYACDDTTKFQRYLPAGARIAHKTGYVDDIRTDAGWVETVDGTMLYCVMTHDNVDRGSSDQNSADLVIGEIGRIAYETFKNQAPVTAPSLVQTLRTGSRGDLVEGLQRTLNGRMQPSPSMEVDGVFGPETKSVVRRFQTEKNLAATGIVDRDFWMALGPIISAAEAAAVPAHATPPKAKLAADSLSGPPLTTASAWTIVDAKSGIEIAGSSSGEQRHPASVTKIMTAYLVLELAEKQPQVLEELLTFSRAADDVIGSSSELVAGEQISVGDLLYGLLLPSGNDASVALAEHFGGRVSGGEYGDGLQDFIAAMNSTAERLGMLHTTYKNTHGLTSNGHLTTAADLAILAKAAMQLPLFRKIVGTARYVCRVGSESGYQRDVAWKNTNRLLRYEGFTGIKTGTTSAAGCCLVASGTRDGIELIVVVLGSASSDSRYIDSRNLFRWGWSHPKDEKTTTK
ncbi:serine hydrolase [Allorhodopirellula solitaria]|uniref:beta-lactamase n=1 Tax=Allorhodopirellula solitaria TaxID=2527987 RepID=A0A5C5X9A8_9BACT|nr:serine hydrolase [Allorhodopirellula solitaria]TWT59299.1 D-alanyl-D-alanine carboxypeptidase DacB precursor [Allorhodopirellula solitaria]